MVGGGWWVGGWTKTKLMLFSTQVVVELKLELSLAILSPVDVLCFLRLSIFKGHASLQFGCSLIVVMMNFYLARLFFLVLFHS